MKRKKFFAWLLLCLVLCACGKAPAEVPAEPPVPEPESSSSSPAEESRPAEPEISIIEGYSLEEMGYSVVFPEHLAELEDPNENAQGQPYFKENSHNENLYAPSFLNGNCTAIDIGVAAGGKSYESYTLRILQCYRHGELAEAKSRVRFKDGYLDASELEVHQIYRTDEIMICDLTDLFYMEGKAMEGTYYSFSEYLALTNVYGSGFYGYDNSWLLDQYNYFADHILEMIYDADGNPLAPDERMSGWTPIDGTAEKNIIFRFTDRQGAPVAGLYMDIVPRIVAEPGEKRVQTGPVPVLSGYTDQNGELIWKEYFPCRPKEEYLLTVTSAPIGNRDYTNSTHAVLPDLSKLEGSYTAEYLWEQKYDSSTAEHQFWSSLKGYWNGPKNHFIILELNEKGQPIFCAGLYDAGGGRGYGTVTEIRKNPDGSATVSVYYPEHPESLMMGYLPEETVQLVLLPSADGNLLSVSANGQTAEEYYRAGSDRDTAYSAYAALHHDW